MSATATLPAWWAEVEAVADIEAAAQAMPPGPRRPPTSHAADLEEAGWRDWLAALFPAYVAAPFAARHEAFWDWVWALVPGAQSRPFVAIWPRGGAKCLDGDSEVLCADGLRRPIRDIRAGQAILSFNETTGRIEPDTIRDHIASGRKRCLSIATRSGRRVVLTADHRVLTFEGWKRAGDLTARDRIASPRRTPIAASTERRDEEVRLLAYMIAEGATSSGNCTFTNCDPAIVADFHWCAEVLGFPVRVASAGRTYRLNEPGRSWVFAQGLRDCRADQKRLPAWVFTLPEYQRWMFLAAFIDTDGWIQSDRGRIGITLANEALVHDLAYLFLSVGVTTSIHEKPNSKRGAWAVIVHQEHVGRCREHLPLLLKGEKLDAALTTPRYSLIDVYPREAKNVRYGMARALRDNHVTRAASATITRDTMRRMIEFDPQERWLWLEGADVFWDLVQRIEWVDERDTYDVEVSRNHNLITDGLITHNSTSAELACVALGARGIRRYVLYVSATQEQADDHVGNVAALLESDRLAAHYPALAERLVGKFGNARGWRRNRVRAASGLTVDAIGLDTAARGVKLDDARPDLIILDDIDGEDDSAHVVGRKVAALTRKLLPAGSGDVAVLAVQNLVHPDSIFAQLADGRADFLAERIVSGPFPAVAGLEVATHEEGNGRRRYAIVAGEATWAGQPLDVCEGQIRRWGLAAFLAEAQHEVKEAAGGIFDHLDYRRCDPREVPDLVRSTVWCDPAVTSHDDSDCSAIQADGLAADGTIYRLFSWEGKDSPEGVIARAIAKAIEIGSTTVGIETDQGGDTWESVYKRAVQALRDAGRLTGRAPRFASAKAGQGYGSKVHRVSRMVPDYERGEIVHVRGTHATLERAQRRFPKVRPLDLADVGFWGWADLRGELKTEAPLGPSTADRTASATSRWGRGA